MFLAKNAKKRWRRVLWVKSTQGNEQYTSTILKRSFSFIPYRMPFSFEEINKLSDKEKLKLIDDILESIDQDAIDDYLTDKNEDNILQERLEKYKSGKTIFTAWEDVQKKKLREEAQKRMKKDND